VSDTAKPRLKPIPYDDWDFEALAEISPGMKPPEMSVVGFFAHHPEMAREFLVWNHYVNGRTSTLPRRVREIAILRVAWRRRSRYEWAQHLKIARRAGVTEEEIATGRSAEEGSGSGLARLLVTAVDELIDTPALSDATYEALSAEFDERALIDLVFLIGTYSTLSMAFNTFGVELDPGMDAEDFDLSGTTKGD
jgi:alkylhydroperoxidase family enzyme